MTPAKEPRGQELIKRYKLNYNISNDIDISEDMILRHWELEKNLTKQLMESSNENRWETFDRCYTKLYSELDWINKFSGTSSIALNPAIMDITVGYRLANLSINLSVILSFLNSNLNSNVLAKFLSGNSSSA